MRVVYMCDDITGCKIEHDSEEEAIQHENKVKSQIDPDKLLTEVLDDRKLGDSRFRAIRFLDWHIVHGGTLPLRWRGPRATPRPNGTQE